MLHYAIVRLPPKHNMEPNNAVCVIICISDHDRKSNDCIHYLSNNHCDYREQEVIDTYHQSKHDAALYILRYNLIT